MAVTAKDLERRFGISRRTLSRYTKAGLIPAPLTAPRPGRPGTDSFFADAVVDTVERIQQFAAAGKTLQETAEAFAGVRAADTKTGSVEAQPIIPKWDSPLPSWPDVMLAKVIHVLYEHGDPLGPEAPPLNRDPNGPAPTAREVLRHGVFEEVWRSVENPRLARETADAVAEPARLSFAIALLLAGYNPVAVRTRVGENVNVHVTTDFMVGHEVEGTSATILAGVKNETDGATARMFAGCARLVVPLASLIESASQFTDQPIELPIQAFARPSQEITWFDWKGDYSVNYAYSIVPLPRWPHDGLVFELRYDTGRTTQIGDLSEDKSARKTRAKKARKTKRR